MNSQPKTSIENDEIKTVERVSCAHGACNITLEKEALDKDYLSLQKNLWSVSLE